MQLTRHTDYALRILMYLGAHNDKLVSVAEIAEYYVISRNHLVKVVQGLTESGFVSTIRGKHGGMRLARNANDISIGDIVRHMETHFNIVDCFDNTADICEIEKVCKLKNIFHHAIDNFLKELDDISLAEVLNPKLCKQLVTIS